MARSTTVITSIISGGKSAENVTVDSTSWSTDNGTITLDAAVPGTVVIGDTITDNNGNSYLITNISGSDLTCQDFDSTTDPVTGAGTIQEAYQSMIDWEADLDDSTIYASGDDAVGECYADATFSDGPSINGGTSVGLSSIELRAAEGEENDGTSGTGVRIVKVAANSGVYMGYGGSPGLTCTVSDIEVDMNGYNHYAFFCSAGGTVNSAYIHVFRRCIGHSVGNGTTDSFVFCQINRAWVRFLNCIAYDANQSTGSSRQSFGFGSDGGGSNGQIEAYNCTAYNIRNSTSSGVGAGFDFISTSSYVHLAVNCISCDTSGSSSNIYDYYGVDDSYSLSSDATATGTGSLINKSSADQFISTTGGSEDLRLKAGADAIDAGTDVGTSSDNVEISINGVDRDAKGYTWDMGAYEYVLLRSVDVTTSLISGGKTAENVTVSSVDWNDSAGVITLSASVPAGVNIGDTITDNGSNSYLIFAIDGSDIHCQDFDSTTDPVTGAATIQEAYQSITTWEADLDDTIIYRSGDNAIGECYADADFDEIITINGGDTVGLSTIKLTAPSSERHDGTAGTGACIANSANATGGVIEIGEILSVNTISWLEFDGSNSSRSAGISFVGGSNARDRYVSNNIVHSHYNNDGYGIFARMYFSPYVTYVTNNIVYDINSKFAGNYDSYGIRYRYSNGTQYIANNTVHNITQHASGTGDSYGIADPNDVSHSGTIIINNISTDCDSEDFYGGADATKSYNMSSDATASGTGAVTSVTTADQYVSVTGGSEDLHIKTGSDAIDAGSDLGTTVTGVQFDINGRDRDTEGDTWDIGAHEFVSLSTPVDVDAIINTSYLLTLNGDSVFNKSALLLLNSDATLNRSNVISATKDSIINTSSLLTVNNDGVLNSELLASIIDDSILNTSSKLSLLKDSVLNTSSLLSVLKDSTINDSALLSIIGDAVFNYETLSSVLSIDKDSVFNTAVLSSILTDGGFNTSSLLSLYRDSVVNQSNLLTVSSDGVINTASGLNLGLNSAFNTATLLSLYRDGVLNTSNTLSITADDIFNTSNLLSINSDDVINISYLGTAVSDVSQDGIFNTSTLLELNIDSVANTPNLASLYRDSAFNRSSFLSVVNDSEINVGNLLQLNIDSTLNDAVLASLDIDSVFNNETFLLVVNDSTLNNCYAAGVDIDSVIPLSWLGVEIDVDPINYWVLSTRDTQWLTKLRDRIWNINSR